MKKVHIHPVSLLLLQLILHLGLESCSAWHGHFYFPSPCSDFRDTRTNKTNRFPWSVTMKIPAHLTGTGKKDLEFFLVPKNSSTHAKEHEALCRLANSTVHEIHFDVGSLPPKQYSLAPCNPVGPDYSPCNPPKQMYFTSDGYVYYRGHFYNPDEYCVLSLNDTTITLKTCEVDCSANVSTSYWYHEVNPDFSYSASRICVPKCCGLDEVFSLETHTCRKLEDTEPFYFLPYLYLPDPIWFHKEENNPADHFALVKFVALHNTDRSRWNSTASFGLRGTVLDSFLDQLHFYRNFEMKKCNKVVVEEFKFGEVGTRKARMKDRKPFRLEVQPGHVVPTHLTRSRMWAGFEGEFCVDGADKWGQNDTVQVVVMCTRLEGGDDDDDDDQFASTSAVVINSADVYLSEFTVHWAYTACSIFSCLVLLLNVFIYMSLRETLTLQGCVIVGHCMSMLFAYFFSTMGHLAFLHNFEENWDNPHTAVKKYGEAKIIGAFCFVFAIGTHVFQLSTYCWLTVMNSKAIKLIPIPFLQRVAASREEAKANKILAFRFLQAFAWGPPMIIVLIFLLIDVAYWNPFWNGFVVPDYAVESCHVAAWAAGWYVHLPIGILLGISFLGILHRFLLRWYRSLQVDGITKLAQLKARESDEYFEPSLFRAVWCIQFTSWFLLFLLWFEVYMGYLSLDWLITVFLFLTLVGEPLALLFLYCMNDKILEKFCSKYPSSLGIVTVLRKCRLVWRGDGLVGNCLKEEFGTDTVVIDAAAEEAVRMRTIKDNPRYGE